MKLSKILLISVVLIQYAPDIDAIKGKAIKDCSYRKCSYDSECSNACPGTECSWLGFCQYPD